MSCRQAQSSEVDLSSVESRKRRECTSQTPKSRDSWRKSFKFWAIDTRWLTSQLSNFWLSWWLQKGGRSTTWWLSTLFPFIGIWTQRGSTRRRISPACRQLSGNWGCLSPYLQCCSSLSLTHAYFRILRLSLPPFIQTSEHFRLSNLLPLSSDLKSCSFWALQWTASLSAQHAPF